MYIGETFRYLLSQPVVNIETTLRETRGTSRLVQCHVWAGCGSSCPSPDLFCEGEIHTHLNRQGVVNRCFWFEKNAGSMQVAKGNLLPSDNEYKSTMYKN